MSTLEQKLIKTCIETNHNTKEGYDLFYSIVRHLESQDALKSLPLEYKREAVYNMITELYKRQ